MTHVEPAWTVAREAAHASGRALGVETEALDAAYERITAAPVYALTPLPPHAASAMDGWAVSGEGPWRIVGSVLAGHVRDEPLTDGQAVVIATGAAVPAGATAVLRSEHGRIDDAGVLHGETVAGQDIRAAGEEITAGEQLLAAGIVLGPAHVGIAAAGGHDALQVARRARARVLIFGDELLRVGPARDGRIRDSLGPQVPAWLARFGIEVVDVRWIEDTLDAHTRALADSTDVDIVVTTGGTAAGPVDYLHAALAATGGELVVDTVACRPGHPMLLGTWGDRWLVGLPGNPQAAVVALFTLCQPLAAALHGCALPALELVTIGEAVKTRGPNTRLVPCTLVRGRATPVDHIGSGMLRGLTMADGFAVIPPGGCDANTDIHWLPLLG